MPRAGHLEDRHPPTFSTWSEVIAHRATESGSLQKLHYSKQCERPFHSRRLSTGEGNIHCILLDRQITNQRSYHEDLRGNVPEQGHLRDASTLSLTIWEAYQQQPTMSFRSGCTTTALSAQWTLSVFRKRTARLTMSTRFPDGMRCTQDVLTRMEAS